MHSQTYNKQSENNKPNLTNLVTVSIIGSLMLISGFFISLFLFAVSAIIFPFAAFKIWRVQRQHQKDTASKQASNTEDGVIIDAEYVGVEKDNT